MDVHAQFNMVSRPFELLALNLGFFIRAKTTKRLANNGGDNGSGENLITSLVANQNLEV